MAMTQQAIITGGQGDLAQAMATELVNAGMLVSCPGRVELDVCDEVMVNSYFAEHYETDLLVCNAGITEDGLLLRMDESSWDKVVNINLKGAFLTARAAAKMMMKRRVGHIVFISSYSAFHPPVGQVNYASAKAALTGMALSLAKELGSRNIRVNVIIPGFMETKMTEAVSEEARAIALEKQILGRFNMPESLAKFLRALHLDMSHTSGQVFNLDSRVL